MFGTNPTRKQELRDDGFLRVQEIFPTIQGEGPYAGRPAIFLRLAGCNLHCFFCDTDFESQWDNLLSPADVLSAVETAIGWKKISLLVITGGEPLLQNLEPFLYLLREIHPGIQVQLETAGTVWPDTAGSFIEMNRVSIVVSPKTPKISQEVANRASAWKYIVREGELHPDDGLPVFSTQCQLKTAYLARPQLHMPRDHIYLQPCDEGNPERNLANIKEAIKSCMEHGYRLCLQQHKLVGLP